MLEGPTADHKGGQLSVSNLTLTSSGVTLWTGALHWDLPDGQAGEEKEVARIDLSGAGQKLMGLKVDGLVALRLGHRKTTDAYYAVAGLHLALPDIFKAGPSPGAGGVTGDVAVNIDDAGVHLDGLKIAVTNAYIGSIRRQERLPELRRRRRHVRRPLRTAQDRRQRPQPFLQCNSNPGADRWDGAAAIVLPTASHTELGLWAGLSGGSLVLRRRIGRPPRLARADRPRCVPGPCRRRRLPQPAAVQDQGRGRRLVRAELQRPSGRARQRLLRATPTPTRASRG